MGSYAQLYLGHISIAATKGGFDPSLMILFREEDKVLYEGKVKDLPNEVRENTFSDYDSNDDVHIFKYVTSSKTLVDRLTVLGYSLGACKKSFNVSVQNRLTDFERYQSDFAKLDDASEYIQSKYLEKIFYENITPEKWLENLHTILEGALPAPPQTISKDSETFLLDYMRSKSFYSNQLGFPSQELCVFLRLALEYCTDTTICYDLSDLCYDGDDPIIENAQYMIQEDVHRAQKTIILTEGSTDRVFLSRSLNLLYPHLADYYRFFDYDDGKLAPGAPNLRKLVQSFSSANIVNRVIALFDNDAAGHEALLTLNETTLTDNIVATYYPDLEIAKCYPTIGPTGSANADVRECACSLEFYLGEDLLLNQDHTFAPVQWSSLNNKIGKYQGELTSKKHIQKEFKKRLEECEADPTKIVNYDWEGLHKIFNTVFTAFHPVDEKELIEIAEADREYIYW